jgi:hypothetical protein
MSLFTNGFDPVFKGKTSTFFEIGLNISNLSTHFILAFVWLDLIQGYVDVLRHCVLLLQELVDEISLLLLALRNLPLPFDSFNQILLSFFVFTVTPTIRCLQWEIGMLLMRQLGVSWSLGREDPTITELWEEGWDITWRRFDGGQNGVWIILRLEVGHSNLSTRVSYS